MAFTTVWLDHFERLAFAHEADGAVEAEEILGEGGGDGDSVFFGGGGEGEFILFHPVADIVGGVIARLVIIGSGVDKLGHIGDDPDIGERVEFKFFNDETATAGGAGPMDAAEAIARGIITDAGGVGGDVMGTTAEGVTTGEEAEGEGELVDINGHGVDDDAGLGGDITFEGEEAEGVTAVEGHGAELVAAALGADGANAPTGFAAGAEGTDDAAGEVIGDSGEVTQFEPQFGDEASIAHGEAFIEGAADAGAAGAGKTADMRPMEIGP